MDLSARLNEYLDSKANAWAPSTLKVESAVLRAYLDLLNGNPVLLWDHFEQHLSPYTRSVHWNRIISFWDFVGGENPYRTFKQTNRRQFKHVYQREVVQVSYSEARSLILGIQDESVKVLAINILRNGMRFSEALTEKDGIIIGKGSKPRRLMLPILPGPKFTGSYSYFWKVLGRLGLKPHTLRKLAASAMVEQGMVEADLLKVLGWQSFETAKIYLQPKKDRELAGLMEKAWET